MKLKVTACFGLFDKTEGACVGWRQGGPEDRLPCANAQYCRTFAYYLKRRGHEVSTYIESWVDEDGERHQQPSMGGPAFSRFCQELVSELWPDVLAEGGELPSVPGPVRAPQPVEEDDDEEIPAAKKIARRGPYPTRKRRMDRVVDLTNAFLEALYQRVEPWRRTEFDSAPAFGQVFLSNIQKGRYLTVYVRAIPRNVPVAHIRYLTLQRALVIEVDIAKADFLRLVPNEARRFKRKIVIGRTRMIAINGLNDLDDLKTVAEVIGKAIDEGLIVLPPRPE